jgi:hypothetical protein
MELATNPVTAALRGATNKRTREVNWKLEPTPEGPPRKLQKSSLKEAILAPTSIDNDVDTQKTNFTWRFLRKPSTLRDRYLDPPQRYQIMVEKKAKKLSEAYKRAPNSSFKGTYLRIRIMSNIPTWNYKAHNAQLMPKEHNEVVTAEQYFSKYAITGHVISEKGGTAPYQPSNMKQDPRQFVISSGGWIRVFNYWGKHLKIGTKLFFIVKKIYSDGKFTLLSSAHGNVDHLQVSDVGKVHTHLPFQLIPYAHHNHSVPPVEHIMYLDEFKREQKGFVIEFGKVLDLGLHGDDAQDMPMMNTRLYGSKKVSRDVTALLAQPFITVSLSGL